MKMASGIRCPVCQSRLRNGGASRHRVGRQSLGCRPRLVRNRIVDEMSSYATLTESDMDDMFRELRSAAREELIENEIQNEMEDVNDEIEGERTARSRTDSPVRTASREGSETVFVVDGSHRRITDTRDDYIPPSHGAPKPHGVHSQRPVSSAEQEALCQARSPRMSPPIV